MNIFDDILFHFINQFAHRSLFFDNAVFFVTFLSLFKGTTIMAIFWWLWFKETGPKKENRKILLVSFFACVLSLLLARLLANTLPFRLRPINNPQLQMIIPFGLSIKSMQGWSSFPSDHATMFFMLASSFVYVSKRVGSLALIYVTFVICLPRVFLGLHYPTDILAGAFIGVMMTVTVNYHLIRDHFSKPFLKWLEKSPPSFYAGFFLLSYLLSTNFDDVRKVAIFIKNAMC